METLRKLRLLLWKNFTLKKRQPFVVFVEIVWPVVLLLVMLIVRKNFPPHRHDLDFFPPRALPSAGLVPFLQGVICDPTMHTSSSTPPTDDVTNFHSFNPRADEALANASVLLNNFNATNFDPETFSENLRNFVVDEEKLNAAFEEYSRTGDMGKLESAIGLPLWRGDSSMIPVSNILRNPAEFEDFLARNDGFSSSAARAFVASSIDLTELQRYVLAQSLALQRCLALGTTNLTRLGECYYGWRQSPFSSAFAGQGLSNLGRLLNPSSSTLDSVQTELTALFLDSGVLQKLACNDSQEFEKIFIFSNKADETTVEQLFCNMTSSQATALTNELQAQLNLESLPQVSSDSTRNASLIQKFYKAYNQLSNQLPAFSEFQNYVENSLPELRDFDFDAFGGNGTSNGSAAKSFACAFFCGASSKQCNSDSVADIGSDAPPITYQYSTAKGETSLLYRLLNGFKILYAPDTPAIQEVIHKANRTFREVDQLKDLASRVVNWTITLNATLESIRGELSGPLNQSYSYVSTTCSLTGSTLERMQSLAGDPALGTASIGLKYLLNDLPSLRNGIRNTLPGSDAVLPGDDSFLSSEYCDYLQRARNFLEGPELSSYLKQAHDGAQSALDALSSFSLDVWMPFEDEDSLIEYAGHAARNRSTVWAAVVFTNLTSDGSLDKWSSYRIRMNTTLIPIQNELRQLYWSAGPESHPYLRRYELFGFVYIQDMVDRAIVNTLTGKNVTEPGAYLQEMPYPCFVLDRYIRSISGSLPLFMALAWVFSVSMIIRSIVHEKEARLKEIMKIMGLKNASLWLSWFITSIIIMAFICLILTMCLKFSNILVHSDFFVIFLFFLNYAFATICLCFLFSTFFGRANLAACSGGILYLFTYLPYIIYIQYESEYGFSRKAGLSLLSTTAFGAATTYVGRLEEQGVGVVWGNLGESTIPGDSFSFLAANVFIALDGVIYFVLAWYIDQVFPGQYGIPKPFYFPFLKSYWCGNDASSCQVKRSSKYDRFSLNGDCAVETSATASDANKDIPYEKEPENLKIGVSVRNLIKIYGRNGSRSKPAVDDLTINFCEGQITSFLGHNGAGKTTTMSVLTGLFPATSGSAHVLGMDVKTEIDGIRKVLGLCPQHNVLFEKLTVSEHLEFFAQLKGMKNKKEVRMEVDRWIEDLGLTDKKKAKVSELSGGMKRKLSVAMAYIGGSKVVVLDEPTAGVDPYARRGIWDLVAKHREGRTVVLSTHYMDEADVLGDRIAIIAHGKLCCAGSPLFLKRHFSDGYTLTLTKRRHGSDTSLASAGGGGSHPVEPASTTSASMENLTDGGGAVEEKAKKCDVMRIIQSHVPEAKLVEDVGAEVSYVLPTLATQGGRLPALLKELDQRKDEVDIASYGISASPLEEVFLKVTNETEEDIQPDPTTGHSLFNRLRRRRWGDRQSRQKLLSEASDEIDSHSLEEESREPDDSEAEECLNLGEGDAGSCTVTGSRLYAQQFKALTVRHFQHTKRYVKGFVAQFLLPAVFVTVALVLKMFATVPEIKPMELSASLYPGTTYFPVRNFDPNSTKTTRYADVVAQPCGIGAHYLAEKMNYDRCKTYKGDGWTVALGAESNATCHCNADGNFVCPSDVGSPKPPELKTIGEQVVQDLTSKSRMSRYLIDTTSQYILERYFGASFGHVNPHLPQVNAGPYQDVMDGLAVRKAAKAWFNNKAYHASPISLNALNNALLRGNLDIDDDKDIWEYGISTYSYPFNETAGQLFQDQLRSGVDLLIAICVIFALAFVPPSFIMILIRERASGAKHLQLVSGVHPVMYWVSNFVWHMLNYMVTVICLVIIFVAFQEKVYTTSTNFAAVICLLVLYGWAMIPLMYPATFIFRDGSTAYVVTMAVSLLVGLTTTMATFILQLLDEFGDGSGGVSTVGSELRTIFLVFPNFCLGRGLMDIAYSYYINQANAELEDYGFQIESTGPFSLSVDGIGRNLISMAVCGLLFFGLVLLIEYKFFAPKLCSWRGNLDGDEETNDAEEDDDVKLERERVNEGRTKRSVLTIKNLAKVYGNACSDRPCHAVKDICLAVPKGECFGLLGVNGAGKTTTFKMLTGDVSITGGNARILNYDVATEINHARRHIGYCPQFDAINDLLTGKEHLALYSRLKGIAESDIPKVVEWCLKKLALTRYGDMPAGKYSGGNKRKLSTAIALIGQPQIIFLDEPTTGMDPKARRFLWSVINSLVREGKSIILTSHSMEECEALCTRLAVMVNGQFKCLGNVQHLKSKFGDGYTVSLRISGAVPNVEPVKKFFRTAFVGAELKDEHHNMLEYQLPLSQVSLPTIFSQMDAHREQLEIEDYSVSQTTMDQVFIRFAKLQGVNDETAADKKKTTSMLSRIRVAFHAGRQRVAFINVSANGDNVDEEEELVTGESV